MQRIVNRLEILILGGGLLLSMLVTIGNFCYLSPQLGLGAADRLQTSIEVFIAAISAVGVIYAGVNLRLVSHTQSESKAVDEARYVQSLTDEWNLEVESNLDSLDAQQIANHTAELTRVLWFFEKVYIAMSSCKSLRKRLRKKFATHYWRLKAILKHNQVRELNFIPLRDLDIFDEMAAYFGEPN